MKFHDIYNQTPPNDDTLGIKIIIIDDKSEWELLEAENLPSTMNGEIDTSLIDSEKIEMEELLKHEPMVVD